MMNVRFKRWFLLRCITSQNRDIYERQIRMRLASTNNYTPRTLYDMILISLFVISGWEYDIPVGSTHCFAYWAIGADTIACSPSFGRGLVYDWQNFRTVANIPKNLMMLTGPPLISSYVPGCGLNSDPQSLPQALCQRVYSIPFGVFAPYSPTMKPESRQEKPVFICSLPML